MRILMYRVNYPFQNIFNIMQNYNLVIERDVSIISNVIRKFFIFTILLRRFKRI